MKSTSLRPQRTMPVMTATTAICAAVAALYAPATHASSHREAPFITTAPKVDASDFYMFNSYEAGRGAYVTLIEIGRAHV